MSTIFFGLTFFSLFIVTVIMFVGMFAMTKGGEFNKKYGNRLMRARVYFQGLTLLFFALALVTQNGS